MSKRQIKRTTENIVIRKEQKHLDVKLSTTPLKAIVVHTGVNIVKCPRYKCSGTQQITVTATQRFNYGLKIEAITARFSCGHFKNRTLLLRS